MNRFFIPGEWISDDAVTLKGDVVHQIRDVVRLRKGDHIIVLDDSGREYEVVLHKMSPGSAEGRVQATRMVTEPGVKITLYQALLKGNKLEFVLQKCTEIGVSTFIPIICEHCIANTPGNKKLERWRRIVTEAAEQSGRGKVPRIEPAIPLQQACQSAVKPSFIADTLNPTSGLRPALRNALADIEQEAQPMAGLFIGPEGGFSNEEIDLALQCGIQPITLGNRVLRAETAGMVAATAILYECGELDSIRV